MTIEITQAAASQILASAQHSGMQGMPLRIAAKRNAEGSIEYAMGHDDVREHDSTLHYHGVDVIVAPTSTELLSGATLDYVGLEEGDSQFIFLNPNDPAYVPPV